MPNVAVISGSIPRRGPAQATFVISHYNIQMRNLKKSVNNVAIAIQKREPAQTIFCHRLQYPLRTSNATFETIPVNNVVEIIKIPNIGGYRYMGAMRRRGPTQPIFNNKSPADIKHI